MKLRDIKEGRVIGATKQQREFEAWTEENRGEGDNQSPSSVILIQDGNSHSIEKSAFGKDNPGYAVQFVSKPDNQKWAPPSFIKPSDWSKFPDVVLYSYVIDDFSKIPDSTNVELAHCEIKSLKGIEKFTTMEFLSLSSEIDCGLLSALKCKSLKKLKNDYHSDEGQSAAKIVNKYLNGDRDIVACQAELIDNDLEEFAKL